MLNIYLDKAFQILRRNFGCPGNDGISISDVKKNYEFHKEIIQLRLNSDNVWTGDIRIKEIMNFNGKKRKIWIYNIYDRWIQQAVKLYLEEKIDILLPYYVYAYRKNKNFEQGINLFLKNSPRYLIKLDVKNFAPSINHTILEDNLKFIKINNQILDLIKTSISGIKGLPAGNCFTPILLNFYLLPIDKKNKNNYLRYSDDFYIISDNYFGCNEIIEDLKIDLSSLFLELNMNKTKIIHNPEKKDFL